MTPKEFKDKVREYECEIGESWTDQGGVQYVDTRHYVKWLLENGYREQLENIFDDPESYIDAKYQEDWNKFMGLYGDYEDGEWLEHEYDKNLELLGEYIISQGETALQQNLDWIDFDGASHKGSMMWDRKWEPEYYAKTIKEYPKWDLENYKDDD